MDYIIKKLPAESWHRYKDMRLEALKTDPIAFSGIYKQEKTMSEQQWQTCMENMFFAVAEDALLGMVGLIENSKTTEITTAKITSFWVNPKYRGQGIGKALLHYLQNFAKEHGIQELYLVVTESQSAAIVLYTSLGFENAGTLKNNIHFNDRHLDQYVMKWRIPSKTSN